MFSGKNLKKYSLKHPKSRFHPYINYTKELVSLVRDQIPTYNIASFLSIFLLEKTL